MNLLFLSAWFPYPPDNGSKLRVYHLLRALGARHQVTLMSLAFDTADPGGVDDVPCFCARVQAIQRNPFKRGRVVTALRFFSMSPVVVRPLPEMARAVHDVLDQNTFDLAIASTEVMASYALKTPPGTARVLEEHNSMSRWIWERYQEQTSVLQRLRCWASWQKIRWYEDWLFRRFDLCTMVSEMDRRYSVEMLPGNRGSVEMVPNGVDCEHNRPGLVRPTPHTLIFNGALTYSANYDAMRYFLAEVYPCIQQQVPNVSLTITGSTVGVDLAGLRLDSSVRLSGYVGDVRLLVAGAWACVVPLRQGGGTRLKVLEAMALGTPVVSTSKAVEGLDVIPDEHVLVADEPAEFARQVLRLLGDADLRVRLAASGRHLMEEKYNWEQIGAHFADLCEAVVRCKR